MTQKSNINLSSVAVNTVIVAVITCLINWGIFVTFKDMYAYAAPKESVEQLAKQLDRIELKVNELCIKQHIKVNYEDEQ
jgi:hypothetical protein